MGSPMAIELGGLDAVVVVGRPVPVGERRRRQPVLGDEPGDRLHVGDPRLAAAQAEGHEPVLAGPDLPRDPDARPRALAAHLGTREPAHVAHRGDHHRLLHGHVHDLGPPRGQGAERGHDRLGPDVRPGRRLGAPHRRPVGVPRAVHVPRRRHHPEVARPPRRPGAVGAEGGDEDPHRGRGPRRVHLQGAGPARGAEHDVGVGEELGQAGVVGPARLDAGLAGAPRREAQGRAVGTEGGNASQRVAAGRFDLHHRCSEIGEDPPRHLGGLPGQVDHAQAGQQRLGHGLLAGHPADLAD